MKFSDRMGFTTPISIIQIDSMNDALSNRLWNGIEILFRDSQRRGPINHILEMIQDYWFKMPINDMPSQKVDFIKDIRKYFLSAEWYNKYNFIEFLIEKYPDQQLSNEFLTVVNMICDEEMSGYRLVDGNFIAITNRIELENISDALDNTRSSEYNACHDHLKKALVLFSKKPAPDYRNCIKESISAVESMIYILSGTKNFERATAKLKDKYNLDGGLISGIKSIYGYTSNTARHGKTDIEELFIEDATFLLITCSSIINFILQKINRYKS